jgi:undecaprenyl diphosphate synthase
MPDPDLLIRTGAESRVSNFLLWQIAYSEIYTTAAMWPEFRKEHLVAAIEDYETRERRFGLTSAQVRDGSGA